MIKIGCASHERRHCYNFGRAFFSNSDSWSDFENEGQPRSVWKFFLVLLHRSNNLSASSLRHEAGFRGRRPHSADFLIVLAPASEGTSSSLDILQLRTLTMFSRSSCYFSPYKENTLSATSVDREEFMSDILIPHLTLIISLRIQLILQDNIVALDCNMCIFII